MADTEITFPQVNLNGTDADSLIAQQVGVMNAARELMDAMRQASPHGRDYQTLPAGTWEKARAEQFRQFEAVEEIFKRAETIALKVQFEKYERERNKK